MAYVERTPWAAMREAKASKRVAYRKAGLREEQDFKPVAFETLGGWDEIAPNVPPISEKGGSDPPQKDHVDPGEEPGEGRGGDEEVPGSPGVPRYPARECRVFRSQAARGGGGEGDMLHTVTCSR